VTVQNGRVYVRNQSNTLVLGHLRQITTVHSHANSTWVGFDDVFDYDIDFGIVGCRDSKMSLSI